MSSLVTSFLDASFAILLHDMQRFVKPVSQCIASEIFVCVGVMYAGEYDVCDVTLSVYPHRAS